MQRFRALVNRAQPFFNRNFGQSPYNSHSVFGQIPAAMQTSRLSTPLGILFVAGVRNYSTDTKDAEAAEMSAKASARDFMEKAKEESFIDEITSYDQWQPKVMDEKKVPIILDLYADWC